MAIVEIRMPDEAKEGTEASLGRWLKAAGETVEEHEPLVEINTDKVTIEIAAPATGRIFALKKQAGDAVGAGEVLGTIDAGATANATAASPSVEGVVAPRTQAQSAPNAEIPGTYSPAVRKLLGELGLDAKDIPKIGRGGRLTPEDVGAYLKGSDGAVKETEDPQFSGRKVPHTPMRKSIANHMARSVQTAPHVTSVFEADLSRVLADRDRRKQETGAAPSVTAYLIDAALKAVKLFPEVNSKWRETYLEVFDHVNFGVGTALESGGLVVPVIRDAQGMDLVALSDALRAMTEKARAGKLTQEDMDGGTFTLSNHGVSGSLLAAPIILPHGQAAILGAGKMQKRVVVCDNGERELFRVRPMMYVTLTVDHRVLDGQQTNGFLTAFVRALEDRA